MKKLLTVLFVFFLVCTFLPGYAIAEDLVSKADKIFNKGDYENTQAFKKSYELYKKALNNNPDSYELNWKASRSSREYAKYSKQRKVDGWEDICVKYGKNGMEYAKKAINIEPDKIEGHFYYGLSVGTYSDGVGIITAVKDGLKDKTKKHLTRAYEINKNYNDATPVLALGRFWQILPLWYDDPDRSLELFKEADKLMPEDSEYRPELHVYWGKLMLDQGIDQEKAKNLLKKAKNSDNPYFSQRAEEILANY